MTTTGTEVEALAGARINGQPVQPARPWRTTVTEPATGEPLFELIGGGTTEARAVLDEAERAARMGRNRAGGKGRSAAGDRLGAAQRTRG